MNNIRGFLIVASLLIGIVSLVSCAPKREVRPAGEIGPSYRIPEKKSEELVLPEPGPEGPRKEEKKKVEKIKRKEELYRLEGEAGQRYIVLNFDDADISTVISTVSEILGINYILAPGVSGKVTIQTYRKFPLKDLFRIFQSILELNGLTAVRDGDVYKIMPVTMARQEPLSVGVGKEVEMQLDASFITQIIPLSYVKASDAANMLRGLLPRGADIIVYEPTNLIIVTARPSALVKIMKILEAVDVSPSDRENLRTFVYYVENGEAKKLAEILKNIYIKEGARKAPGPVRAILPRRRTAKVQRQPATTKVVGGLPGEVTGEISITAYEDINAIIIKTSPRNYLAILETLKKLDIPPKQVLIEVLIAEVTLDKRTQYGIEWLLKGSTDDATLLAGFASSPGNFLGSVSEEGKVTDLNFSPLVQSGAFVNVIDPTKFNTFLSLSASRGKLNVLASPHILAVDNKEATIEIGDDIPIATGLTQQPATGTGATTLVSTGQIQYRTAGVILNVTPHISEKNKVTLKIKQEFSSAGGSQVVAGQEFPKFIKRTANTTAIVQSGHTLVLGGLISDRKNQSRTGIPLLSDIPLLGPLFSTTTDEDVKTELLLMVTPYVISGQEEADMLTRQFQDRVKIIKEKIRQAREREKRSMEKQTGKGGEQD